MFVKLNIFGANVSKVQEGVCALLVLGGEHCANIQTLVINTFVPSHIEAYNCMSQIVERYTVFAWLFGTHQAVLA